MECNRTVNGSGAGATTDGYLTYPHPTTNVARLNVDLSTSMEVIGGTCFQCVFIMIGGPVFSESGCITLVGELPKFILNCSVSFGEQYTMYTLFSVGFIHVPQIFHYHGACKKQWCLIEYSHMPFSAAYLAIFSIVMLCDGLVCSSFLLQSCQSTLLSCMWFLAFLISSENNLLQIQHILMFVDQDRMSTVHQWIKLPYNRYKHRYGYGDAHNRRNAWVELLV